MAKRTPAESVSCMSHLYIIIPFLNEAENIPRLSKNCHDLIQTLNVQTNHTFLLIDDGSTDNSIPLIKEHFSNLNVKIIQHPNNLGPGIAFLSGFLEIHKNLKDDDWVLTMEADNTSNHQIVPKMFKRSEEGFPVILASPYIYGGTIVNTSRFRKFLSFMSNLILKELLGLRGIMTMSSFFRLYKGRVIKHLIRVYSENFIENSGFEGVVELLMKMVYCRIPISEYPLILDTAQRRGKSKMKILRTSYRLLCLRFKKKEWISLAQEYTP